MEQLSSDLAMRGLMKKAVGKLCSNDLQDAIFLYLHVCLSCAPSLFSLPFFFFLPPSWVLFWPCWTIGQRRRNVSQEKKKQYRIIEEKRKKEEKKETSKYE